MSFLFTVISVAEETPNQSQLVAERFWEILVKSPRRGTTFDRVYTYYIDTGHAEQFLERCRNLTEQNPKQCSSWILYGLASERRGELEQAAHAFQTATQLDTKNSIAPFYLGEIRIAQGRFREAITALEIAAQRKPPRADIRNVLQTLGQTYERFGDSKKSETVWNQLEELFPDDPEMLVQIAELLESENRFDEALKRYEKLVAQTSDEFSRVRYMLAIVEIKQRQGKEQAALADLETLLDRLAPESWLAESVRNRIDRIFMRKGNETGLAEFYRKRIEKYPADFESVRRLALTLRQLDQTDKARKLLTVTIEKTPSNIPLRLTLIDFLLEQKEIAAVIEQYEAVDRLEPNNADYLSRWGQLVFQNTETNEATRKTEAVKIWTKIADADPKNPVAAVTVADLLLRNKIYDEAEQYYRRALELRPNDFSYREYLAIFYHSRRQKNKVLETLQPLAEADEPTLESLTQLGNLLLSLGYITESFKMFQYSAELFPNDLQSQWRFIEALIRRGQPEDMTVAALRLTQAERLIETEEQFELFLQQEVQFLKSAQKLAGATEILEQQIEKMQNNNNNDLKSLVRAYWRLAVYRQAEVKSYAATLAIEKALTVVQPSGYRLLRFAAELFEQNGDGEKAVELYKNLAERDTVWRVDHLKHLTSLQVKLGQIDHALETGRTLIGLASGNPAHLRFYADILLSIGNRDEGIDLLRQALRIEPGDIPTLTLLAQTLAHAGQNNEAIEMTWRIFERTDHLSGQLSVIETLTNYYQRSGQLDNLIERLQNRMRLDDKKRETALALARVQATIADFDAARQTLENILDTTLDPTNVTVHSFLLKELVYVAEKQNDLNAAVRFQEKLCDLTKDNFETNKLFELYNQIGDTEKANKLFLSRILQKADLQDQLDDIDLMIGREQYDAVKQVLTFLEIHEAENWEIPFRCIAVDSYLGVQSVTDSVREFRSLSFPTSSVSNATTETSPSVDSALSAWLLPGNVASKNQDSFELANFTPADFLASIRLQQEFFSTLFRNRLRYNERFLKQDTKIFPPKPFLRINSFRNARFLVLGWLIKEAIDQDLKNKNDSNANEFVHFRKTVEEIRTLLSADSKERDVRLERIRFEIFLLDLSQLDNGRNSLANGTLKLQIDPNICNRTIWEIVRNLGLDGETDWQLAAFQILLAEILDERIVNRFADFINDDKQFEKQFDKKLEKKLGDILDENCQRRGLPPRLPDQRAQLIQFAVYLVKQASEKNKTAAATNDSLTTVQKIDRLLEIWETLAMSEEPEQIKIFEQKMASRCPMLVWLLKTSGRKTEIARLETTLEHAAQRNPVFLAEFADELGLSFDDDTILFFVLSGYDSLEQQLKRVQHWILNACEFNTQNEQQQNNSSDFDQRQLQRELLCHAAMKSLRSLLEPVRLGRWDFFNDQEREVLRMPSEVLRDLISFSNQTPKAHLVRRTIGLETEPKRRILRSEHIRQITELERELHLLTESAIMFRDNLLPNISAHKKTTSANNLKNTLIPPLPKPLANYQPELIGQRVVDRTLLQSVLQNKSYYAPLSPFQELLFRIALIRKIMETCIKNSEIDAEIKNDPKTQPFLQLRSQNKFNESFRRLIKGLIERDESLRNVFADILELSNETENEFTRLNRQLESVRKQRTEQGDSADTAELLALALLKAKTEHLVEVVSILDEMELKSPLDTKAREFIAANIGLQLKKENYENKDYRERTEIALDRLLGYRLSDQDAFNLLPILEQWGRADDAQTLLDRLVISVSDRRIQNELLHRMQVAGEKQKDNAVKISLRIIRNHGFFSDSQHFALDFYIYETALKILREYGEVNSVAEQLEIRFKGLKDKTDSLIMLANLYLALDRQNEAKELTLELARNPSRETDRRNAITALLQHFGLTKQLEEMNERLLERTNRK